MTKVIPPAPKVKTVLKGQVKRLEPILRQARYKKRQSQNQPKSAQDSTSIDKTSRTSKNLQDGQFRPELTARSEISKET